MAETMNEHSAVDYDRLMRANLTLVFGERDAAKRLIAIAELYAEDAVVNEPHASTQGHAQINAAVSALLSQLPPDFVFTAPRPAMAHHDIAILQWRSGPRTGPVAVTGMDVAHFRAGRIQSLFVFLNSGDDL